MTRLVVLLVISAVLVALPVIQASKEVNESASLGSYWSSSKEEGDVVRKENLDGSSFTWNDEDEQDLDGGFSSLDGMLQWAIGHSDPTKLKERAEEVNHLSHDELTTRQMKFKELMEQVRMPSDTELMQIAIDDLKNLSLPLEDHLRALQELLILVEPIDNAMDLQKLGGLYVVVRELEHTNTEIRTISAWVLGKACQNNPVVQNHLLEIGALLKLMTMVKSKFSEEAVIALYAVSALIRNNLDGQDLFYAESGELLLQDILSNSSINIRLQKKAVFLVADLAESLLRNSNKPDPHSFSNSFFVKSVVDLLASMDLDLQEKALYAVKSLIQLRSMKSSTLKELCKLDEALEKMGERLQKLITEGDQREYAMDLEVFRLQVLEIFLEKVYDDDNKKVRSNSEAGGGITTFTRGMQVPT